MLFFQRADDVFEAFQICFRRAQAQFGLVPAGVQPGDAGGFFKQASALGRFRVDNCADAALTDHRGRPRTGRGICEQHLDIACPRVHAVYLVVRAVTALDAANDIQFISVVELGRRTPVRVVHRQDNFGKVPRRTVGLSLIHI